GSVGPRAFVRAGAGVGAASVVHARVAVCARVRLGKRVVVHPGAVIGADGLGYAFDGEAHRKIPQVGSVVVEDDVEIGANATVDRATLGQTIIRRGTKIDNLVQIGHNVEIGEHSIIVAQVGISGSCRVGRGVVLAGQVGVAGHPTALVGPGARVHPAARIGAFSIIGPAVTVGADVEIGHHCVLEGRVELAPGVKIGHGSILGGRPQDLKFKEGTPSGVR